MPRPLTYEQVRRMGLGSRSWTMSYLSTILCGGMMPHHMCGQGAIRITYIQPDLCQAIDDTVCMLCASKPCT